MPYTFLNGHLIKRLHIRTPFYKRLVIFILCGIYNAVTSTYKYMMSTMNEIKIFSYLNNIQLRGYEVVSYVLVTMNKIIDIFVLGQ